MRRYEVSDGHSHKFWEVTLHGTSFTVRFGRIGSEGQRRTKEFDTHDEARTEWERLVAEKLRAGYCLVHADGPDASDTPTKVDPVRNPALEQAIAQDPQDEQRFLVYADWLQDHNDPRGELITIQHGLAGERDPGLFLKLRQAEQALLHKFAPYFYGDRLQDHFHLLSVQWRLGFFGKVTLDLERVAGQSAVTVDDLLRALFEAPSARFLQEIRLDLHQGALDQHPIVECLLSEQRPRSLRRLALGGRRCELGQVGALWTAVGPGNLARQLHELTLGALSTDVARSLAVASWPELRRLTLISDGRAVPSEELAPLLQSNRMPALTHLALREAPKELADELCQRLAESSLLSRLEVLDLQGSRLSGVGAAALLQSASRFDRLRRLVLAGTRLPSRVARQLAGLCDDVRLPDARVSLRVNPDGSQEWQDEDERYDEIME